jgi:hypothetical protein
VCVGGKRGFSGPAGRRRRASVRRAGCLRACCCGCGGCGCGGVRWCGRRAARPGGHRDPKQHPCTLMVGDSDGDSDGILQTAARAVTRTVRSIAVGPTAQPALMPAGWKAGYSASLIGGGVSSVRRGARPSSLASDQETDASASGMGGRVSRARRAVVVEHAPRPTLASEQKAGAIGMRWRLSSVRERRSDGAHM